MTEKAAQPSSHSIDAPYVGQRTDLTLCMRHNESRYESRDLPSMGTGIESRAQASTEAGDLSPSRGVLPDLSEKDLERVVTGICSAYGTVMKVVIHVAQAHLNLQAFALVDMSGAVEAERLAMAFNRPRMGRAVLLLLQPPPPS